MNKPKPSFEDKVWEVLIPTLGASVAHMIVGWYQTDLDSKVLEVTKKVTRYPEGTMFISGFDGTEDTRVDYYAVPKKVWDDRIAEIETRMK